MFHLANDTSTVTSTFLSVHFIARLDSIQRGQCGWSNSDVASRDSCNSKKKKKNNWYKETKRRFIRKMREGKQVG